jgi:PKD repeat protein
MGTELSFVVASPFTETVLVWSPYGVQAVSLAPTVTPLNPAPGANVTQYPYYVNARVWTGIPIVTVARAEIHVNSRAMQTSFNGPDILSGYSSPPIPIGTWRITAEVAWGTGSAAATWTATIAPPPPVVIWYQHPRDPLFVGQTIHFDASSSVARDGTITGYEWNFGDGTRSTAPKVDFVYQQAGDFTATLTVRTNIGDSATASTRFVVRAFPDIPLAPYTNSAGFRLPGPSSWNVSENVPVASSVVEVVFRGPTYQSGPTTVGVDARRDSAANESAAYLSGRVDVVVNGLRQMGGGILTVTEPATPRTIACHEGRTFVAVDTYHGIAYRVALVVSATDGRWWIILLTIDPDYLSLYEPMFNSMVNGFEITLGSACAPTFLGGPGGPVLALAAAGGVTAGAAGGVWWTLRARRKRKGPSEPRTSEEKLQP